MHTLRSTRNQMDLSVRIQTFKHYNFLKSDFILFFKYKIITFTYIIFSLNIFTNFNLYFLLILIHDLNIFKEYVFICIKFNSTVFRVHSGKQNPHQLSLQKEFNMRNLLNRF